MNTLVLQSSFDLVMIGAAVLSVSMLLGPGVLTTLGWFVIGPIALGSTIYCSGRVYEVGARLFSKAKTAIDEKNQKKPATAAA